MDTVPAIERKNKFLYLLGTICFLLIIAALISIYIAYKQTPAKQTKTITQTNAKTVIITTPSPAPLQKSEITFEVLNGSAIAGIAARSAETLRSKGYTIAKIDNADKTYQNTQLFLTKSILYHQKTLLADIQKDFPAAEFAGELQDTNASARLIIGTK